MSNEPSQMPPAGGTSPSVASAATAAQNVAELGAEAARNAINNSKDELLEASRTVAEKLANSANDPQPGTILEKDNEKDDSASNGGGKPAAIDTKTGGTPKHNRPKTKTQVVSIERRSRKRGPGEADESDDLSQGTVNKRFYFKRVPKKQRYDVLQRKTDPECFAIGFAQLEQETLQTALNCDDFENPDKDEAVALAKVCLYGGLKMPAAVYEKAGSTTLKMKFAYCSMPFADNKGQVSVHAKAHDRRYGLAYDFINNQPKGGISDRRDIALIKVSAADAGFTFNPQSTDPNEMQTRIDQLEATVAGQHVSLQAYSEALRVAVNEDQYLRDLYKEDVGKSAPRSEDFVKLCEKMNEDKLPVMKVVINDGQTEMRRRRLPVEAPYGDDMSSDESEQN